jgi:hypothetical protein
MACLTPRLTGRYDNITQSFARWAERGAAARATS